MIKFFKKLVSKKLPPKDWRVQCFETLESLGSYEDDWDGYKSQAPNTIAIAHASQILVELSNINLKPNYISAHARCDEGVYFYFSNKERCADILCLNDGDIETACCVEDGIPLNMNKYDFLEFTVEEIPQAVEYINQPVTNVLVTGKINEYRREVGLF